MKISDKNEFRLRRTLLRTFTLVSSCGKVYKNLLNLPMFRKYFFKSPYKLIFNKWCIELKFSRKFENKVIFKSVWANFKKKRKKCINKNKIKKFKFSI